jgi:hypothetical protein
VSKKQPKVPPTPIGNTPAVYVFPCGCIAERTRANRVQQCDGSNGPCSYSPKRPAGTRSATVRRRR